MNDKITYMKAEFKKCDFTFSDNQLWQFYAFYEMLVEKNKVMNLTSIIEFTEVVQKHFIDSISLNKVVNLDSEIKILDLGTGAGFPGIPLIIAYPNLNITLMDSQNKKVLFLKEVIDQMGLINIDAVHARAEELARKKEYREEYDICVSRAVANLTTLEEYCLPFVKVGGSFISYKSGDVEEEVSNSKGACYLLGGRLKEVHCFSIEEGNMQRSFIVVDKVKKTPGTYPRKAGTPAKTPLL